MWRRKSEIDKKMTLKWNRKSEHGWKRNLEEKIEKASINIRNEAYNRVSRMEDKV